MRAEIIHVTDHALMRWKERASRTGEANTLEIIEAVKASKVIKKSDTLPYPTPRVDGLVYTFNDGVLFILETVTIDEYRLVTVMTGDIFRSQIEPAKIKTKKEKHVEHQKIEIPHFESFVEERRWLTEEKRKLEHQLATTETKKTSSRKEILKACNEIEILLTNNKPRWIEEQKRKNDERRTQKTEEENSILVQILKELKELRSENKELRHLIERIPIN